jgi:ubiquinone/menaquinone biosynthesis C-methylase UbiE
MQKKDTSWEKVAPWYDEHLASDDTYHSKVILPNLLRILALSKTERVLDLACGQGFFTRALAPGAGSIIGSDLSPSLIKLAQSQSDTKISYVTADAAKLVFAKDNEFDVVVCVLALQNIEKLSETFAEVSRVLKPDGRFVFVLNHPAFRIPKASSWGFDEEKDVQYRRVDAYLSGSKEKIDMTPGQHQKTFTVSFHRSLQDYSKALRGAGFAITRFEEWISHRKSEKGPRMKAEDRARKEFPLFLIIEASKMPRATIKG